MNGESRKSASMPAGTVFLSYASQDAAAAGTGTGAAAGVLRQTWPLPSRHRQARAQESAARLNGKGPSTRSCRQH